MEMYVKPNAVESWNFFLENGITIAEMRIEISAWNIDQIVVGAK